MSDTRVAPRRFVAEPVGDPTAGLHRAAEHTYAIRIEVCSEAAQSLEDPRARDALVWALVGALFDPSDEVVATALRALGFQLTIENSPARDVVIDRLSRLYEIGSTDGREAVVEAALRLGGDAPRAVWETVARAHTDKSWRVRQAAAGRQ